MHVGQEWIYVAVDDPDALYERAKKAGAEVLSASARFSPL
jgi:hypothetical protein